MKNHIKQLKLLGACQEAVTWAEAAKKVRARKVWTLMERKIEGVSNYTSTTKEYLDQVPVYVLPADAAIYDRMVEQVAERLSQGWVQPDYSVDQSYTKKMRAYYRRRARIALRAIGIDQPKDGR